MKTLKILKHIVLVLWQLPQDILGGVIWIICRLGYRYSQPYKERLMTEWRLTSGLSLGHFIFVQSSLLSTVVKHEYGHTKQSLYLGWLYLLVIGLPSLIWASCFGQYRRKKGTSAKINPQDFAKEIASIATGTTGKVYSETGAGTLNHLSGVRLYDTQYNSVVDVITLSPNDNGRLQFSDGHGNTAFIDVSSLRYSSGKMISVSAPRIGTVVLVQTNTSGRSYYTSSYTTVSAQWQADSSEDMDIEETRWLFNS